MKTRCPVEIHIVTGAAGYTRSVEVMSYTENGDGTDRKKSLGLFTREFPPGIERVTEAGASADQWQTQTVRNIGAAIQLAVRSAMEK